MLPVLDILEFRHAATEIMLRLPGLGSGRDETNFEESVEDADNYRLRVTRLHLVTPSATKDHSK